jgi:hypothetical protein
MPAQEWRSAVAIKFWRSVTLVLACLLQYILSLRCGFFSLVIDAYLSARARIVFENARPDRFQSFPTLYYLIWRIFSITVQCNVSLQKTRHNASKKAP